MEQEKRNGRATSSQMHKVCSGSSVGSPNKPFYTYAEEVAMEKVIGVSLDANVSSAPLKWGSLMECVVFNSLDISYSMTHKKTVISDKYPNIWSGTPDLESSTKGGEIKCPYKKGFLQLSFVLLSKDIANLKKKYPDHYWQVVSNAMLLGKSTVELIAFIPKKSQLEQILEAIQDTDFLSDYNLKQEDFYFYRPENIDSFHYLPDDCDFPNLNMFEFEIPLEDKMFLLSRIKMFEEEVNKKVNEFKIK